MINDLTVQNTLWDRVSVLDRLRKIGVPVAESHTVLRGKEKERAEAGGALPDQVDIEAQAKLTKNRGEYYIDKAKQMKQQKDSEERKLTVATI